MPICDYSINEVGAMFETRASSIVNRVRDAISDRL
jgi:hypothetical protein